MYGIIYLLTSPSDKYYVGQTTQTLAKRWNEHACEAKYSKGCRRLSAAIRKYGSNTFEKQILSVAESKTSLDNLEKLWIILLQADNSFYGYNLKEGGSFGKHNEESKNKNRKAHIGLLVGENHPMYGHHHSEEAKGKISLSAKIRWALQGHPKGMSGKTHSEETRRKMSEAHKNRLAQKYEHENKN